MEQLAQYIACGLDPEKNVLFIQSHVHQHAELGWVLNCYSMFGELSRMTQFKDKSAKNADNINGGLFTYPALMAADILLYQADLVPVGEDQKQHVELTRNIAKRFNGIYGDVFKLPEPYIPKVGARIMSLANPEAKMSKSENDDPGRVCLMDKPEDIMRLFKRAITDCESEVRYDPEHKKGVSNLMTIYSAATGRTFAEIEAEFAGRGYGDFKKTVGEAVVELLRPIREESQRLLADKAYLQSVCESGAQKAAYVAEKTLRKVYKGRLRGALTGEQNMIMDPNFIVKVLLSLIVAAALAFAVTPLVKRLAQRVGAMDVPKDERRMHKIPIPRMGGLAIFFAFLIAVLCFAGIDRELRGILLGATIIVVLGILDDILTLKALPKFAVQIVAAVIAVLHGCRIEHFMGFRLATWLSYPVSVIWIVAITNAVNFIDGLDGLAAGVSAISAGSMLVVALLVPDYNSAILLAAIVGACAGFIPYNFNPAKIFMGDTGSTFLGFMLSSISIYGLFKMYAIISFAVPFLVLGLPIFDICFAVIRRVSKGQSPMHADRGHVHHRLIDMGFSQKQAVAIAYMLSAILGMAAVVLTNDGEMKALIFIGAVIVVGAIGVLVIFHRHPDKTEENAKKPEEEPHEEN